MPGIVLTQEEASEFLRQRQLCLDAWAWAVSSDTIDRMALNIVLNQRKKTA